MTWVSPAMQAPYQVMAGTSVTVQWDYFSSAPTYIYTHDSIPDFATYQFSPNPKWTQHTNWVSNGNGTYNITLTITQDTWIFGGFQSFIGWAYSNAIPVEIISGVSITASDSVICPVNGTDTLTAPTGFDGYLWYKDQIPLPNDTLNTYIATTAGSYFLRVIDGPDTLFTNTIVINEVVASYTGSLSGSQLTLTSDQPFHAYQWLNGTP